MCPWITEGSTVGHLLLVFLALLCILMTLTFLIHAGSLTVSALCPLPWSPFSFSFLDNVYRVVRKNFGTKK